MTENETTNSRLELRRRREVGGNIAIVHGISWYLILLRYWERIKDDLRNVKDKPLLKVNGGPEGEEDESKREQREPTSLCLSLSLFEIFASFTH